MHPSPLPFAASLYFTCFFKPIFEYYPTIVLVSTYFLSKPSKRCPISSFFLHLWQLSLSVYQNLFCLSWLLHLKTLTSILFGTCISLYLSITSCSILCYYFCICSCSSFFSFFISISLKNTARITLLFLFQLFYSSRFASSYIMYVSPV